MERPNMVELMDVIIKVDENLCKGCGSCSRACPVGLITKEKFPVAIASSWDLCIDCGHCVAICPSGALQQRSMQPAECDLVDKNLSISWEQANQFLRARRSIRSYVKKPVEREKILQLLDVARWAPNGGNRQVVRWLVINDLAEVRRIAVMTMDWIKAVKDANPAVYQAANMRVFVGPWEAGHDSIARGAPCVIQAYAPKDERSAAASATIAIAHIQLAAPVFGLGTVFTGIINTAWQSYPPISEAMKLPEGCIPYGTFVVGYPAEKYLRIPKRKPVDVTWRGPTEGKV